MCWDCIYNGMAYTHARLPQTVQSQRNQWIVWGPSPFGTGTNRMLYGVMWKSFLTSPDPTNTSSMNSGVLQRWWFTHVSPPNSSSPVTSRSKDWRSMTSPLSAHPAPIPQNKGTETAEWEKVYPSNLSPISFPRQRPSNRSKNVYSKSEKFLRFL